MQDDLEIRCEYVQDCLSDEYCDSSADPPVCRFDDRGEAVPANVALCDPRKERCESHEPCPDYGGEDPCCNVDDSCGYGDNGVCDCGGACERESFDCHSSGEDLNLESLRRAASSPR